MTQQIVFMSSEAIVMSTALIVMLREGKMSCKHFDEMTGIEGASVKANANIDAAIKEHLTRMNAGRN